MSVFQFPWRFLPFVVFGVAYFASRIPAEVINKKAVILISVALSIILLSSSTKFFFRPWKYTLDEYKSMLLTEKYIQQKAAYEIPEYFPQYGSYAKWRTYDKSAVGFETNYVTYKINKPFFKEIITDKKNVTIPIHYFPFWEIKVNGKNIVPENFDALGRPFLSDLPRHSDIIVRYNETPDERMGNALTLITFIALICICSNKKLWKKVNNTLQ
jgi:hypothetical protein